jgi:hypothetical protein|tara:strand:+ start:110 stop:331 length:222 start_codon:yes stop_codon:yes gene_type:complete
LIDAKQDIIEHLMKNIAKYRVDIINTRDINAIVNILSKNQFVTNNNISRKELKNIIDEISSELVRKDTKESSL